MNVKYINPFIIASKHILTQILGVEPNVEAPKLLDSSVSIEDIVVIVGLTGEISGQVLLSISDDAALKIVRKMTFNDSLNEIDSIGESAIAEVGNMILGSTGMEMYSHGIQINITPPTLCRGDAMIVTSKNKFISIPINLKEFGHLNINISFEEVKA